MRKLFAPFLLLFLIAFAPAAFAQQAAPATLTATHNDVATQISQPLSSNNAPLAAPVVNTQTTVTMTPTSGNYVYITGISFEVCTNGTGSAVNQVAFTSTGITGTPTWGFSLAATASICQRWQELYPVGGLKSSTPGTAVVITSPAAATNNSYFVRVAWYQAP